MQVHKYLRYMIVVVTILLGIAFTSIAQEDLTLEARLEQARNGSERLRLNSLGITEIPPEVFTFTHLTSLDLASNALTSLPPEIGNLSNLKTLILNQNKLTSLPPEIGNLRQLQVLEMEYNRIERLPASMGQLENLRILVANENYISSVPSTFRNLENLETIILRSNSLSISRDIESDPQAILDYAIQQGKKEMMQQMLKVAIGIVLVLGAYKFILIRFMVIGGVVGYATAIAIIYMSMPFVNQMGPAALLPLIIFASLPTVLAGIGAIIGYFIWLFRENEHDLKSGQASTERISR